MAASKQHLVTYPAPVGGWNARDPIADMPIEDAVTLVNVNPRGDYCELRGGYELLQTTVIPVVPTFGALLEDTFETGTYATWWTETYSEAAKYSPNTAQTQIQSSVKHTGSYALNYYIPSAAATDSQPIKLSLLPNSNPAIDIYTLIGTRTEIYVEWYEYFAAGYPWAGTAQKVIQFGYFDGNEEGGVGPVGGTSEDWEIMYMIHTNNTWRQLDFNYAHNSRWSLTDDVDTPEPEGEWTKKGIHFRLNDAGQSNGFLRLYYNGVNIMTKMAIPSQAGGGENLELAPAPHHINSFSIGLNWSNPTNLAWLTSHGYGAGDYCQNALKVYYTAAGGTSGGTPPTHSTGSQSDGGVTWAYVRTLGDGNRYIDDIKVYATYPY
jgi:hypothetical protein